MPAGEWRTKTCHTAGSNGNSGETRDTPYADIGVAYTNLRPIFDHYRGRLQIGPGDYLTEDWPIIIHDSNLLIEGWGTGPDDDPGQNVGVLIRRPDTVASDGQPFMRPLTLAEMASDREIWEHQVSGRGFTLDGNIGTAVTATTRVAPIWISHGGMASMFEDVHFIDHEEAAIRYLYGGIETHGLKNCTTLNTAFWDIVSDADPFSGARYMNGIWAHGCHHSNLTGPDSTPPWVMRSDRQGHTSPGSVILLSGFTTEGSKYLFENQPSTLGAHTGDKVVVVGLGGSLVAATPGDCRVIRELAGNASADGNFWHLIGCCPENPGTEFYDSAHESVTYGSGVGEATEELLEFKMAPTWTVPKVEHKGTG